MYKFLQIYKEATSFELCLKMSHLQKQPFEQLQYFEKKFTNNFSPHSGRLAYFEQIQIYFQKQPFADNLQNRCLKNFALFTGKHLYWSLFLITLQAFNSATLLKRLHYWCFPVNMAKF